MHPLYLARLIYACPSAQRWVRRRKHWTSERLWDSCPHESWLAFACAMVWGHTQHRNALYRAVQQYRASTTKGPDAFRVHVPWGIVEAAIQEYPWTE